MLNDADRHNINAAVQSARTCAATHRGESALQFHLNSWAQELSQPESTDFHRADDTVNLCALARLLCDESTIGPVYTVLMPILDLCVDDLHADATDHADADAAQLSGAVEALKLFLNDRDTTVRETY